MGSLGLSAAARADSTGINFVGGQSFFTIPAGPVTGTAGAPGLTQADWNNLDGTTGSASNLLNASGLPTGISISWNSTDTWQALTGSVGPATQDAQLMNGYLDNTSQIAVSGIPYGTYAVVVYFNNDSPTQDRVSQFTIGSTSVFAQDNASFNGTFVQVPGTSNTDQGVNTPAGNYVVFYGLSGSSFTLDALPGSSLMTERSSINGIQIVSTPEPQSALILLTGLVGLAALGLFRQFKY